MVIVLELRVRARYRIRYVSKAGLFRHFCFDQIILASFFFLIIKWRWERDLNTERKRVQQ